MQNELINFFLNDSPLSILLFILLLIWLLFWKLYAVWYAVKNNHKVWFVFLLVINLFSILEIIYIFAVLKKNLKDINKDISRQWNLISKKYFKNLD